MNRLLITLLLSIFSYGSTFAQPSSQVDLSYYFGTDARFNPEIPEPSEILGYQIGEWHISHDQLLMVVREYCRVSPRLSYKVIGRTYEGRPLIHLYATAAENQENLESLRESHLNWVDPEADDQTELSEVPLVLNLGYTVHGNEASGMNASVLTMYYLAASQDESLLSFLEDNVIIIDPCLNPDGAHRFSTWVNSHKSLSAPDPSSISREHQEAWPGGRTNHYWFDLNRDWLLLRHPESRARITEFHRWKPNILTDHHEMGTNRTFFFQPGIPSRNNPNTPEEVFNFTRKLAEKHAEFLDEIGSLYYTRESFDDFYYGKGSTYPDIHGGVGILFEQASSRGHLQESIYGELSFPFAIRNQLTVSLSTIASASEMRDDLLRYQQQFYQNALREGKSSESAGIAFSAPGDPLRALDLAQRLLIHDIEVSYVPELSLEDGQTQHHVFLAKTDQAQYKLMRAMFDRVTEFQDSLFYDVSTWTFSLSHNLEVSELTSQQLRKVMKEATEIPSEFTEASINESAMAIGYDWSHSNASVLLVWLMREGFSPRISEKPVLSEEATLDYGGVIIPLSPDVSAADRNRLEAQARMLNIPLVSFNSGLTNSVDLGSPSIAPAVLPKIAVLVGRGVSGYEAGEMWHFFDQVLGYPVSMVPMDNVGRTQFEEFTHVIMVNGSYQGLQLRQQQLEEWVRGGGTLIATKGAINWIASQGWSSIRQEQFGSRSDIADYSPFDQASPLYGASEIGGAIFEAVIDQSHPLTFGFPDNTLPVFKNSEAALVSTLQPFGHPIRYAENPLLSGYVSEENLEQVSGAPAAAVERIGRGRIIALADNPVFRASWPGTQKLVENAVFLHMLMD